MLDEGSFLQADGRLLLSSSLVLRAAAVFDGSEIRLNLRAGGDAAELPAGEYLEIALRVTRTVQAVEGAGVRSWQLHGSMLHLRLGAADTDLRITLTSTPTSVAGTPAAGAGAVTARDPGLQVFPQPARTGVALQCRYTLPSAGGVRLVLHDALGRVVATTTDVMREAGNGTMHLSTAGLAPGIYYVRLGTPDGSATRRVVLY